MPSPENTNDGRLADAFSDCIALVLRLKEARDLGDEAVLRAKCKALLDDSSSRAKRYGFSSEQVDDAVFAIVAFLDEVVLSADWPNKQQWLTRPLQMELYDRSDAGERFFERLHQLQKNATANASVIEVFFLCLTLGFKGRYRFVETASIGRMVSDSYESVSDRFPAPPSLSPNGKPRTTVAKGRAYIPSWVAFAACALICMLVYIGMRASVRSLAGDVVTQVETLQNESD